MSKGDDKPIKKMACEMNHTPLTKMNCSKKKMIVAKQ